MFDVITLIILDQTKNQNMENIDVEHGVKVQAEMQTVSRKHRDVYNEDALNHSVRFRVQLMGSYYLEDIPYFYHNNTKYATSDLVSDVTGSSYYIEGRTLRSKDGM